MPRIITDGLKAVVASPVLDEDGDYKEPYFSSCECDECGCMLGGDRYDILYKTSLKQKEPDEATVCTDCYVALCS
jgi:hypothetical protein